MNKEISKVVSRAKEHDADAFMQLVQPYTKKLYQTALSILVNDEDAADAIQETILNCWEKIHTLKESQYFYTWMTRILINNCYDICKKRTRYVEMQDYEEPAVYDQYNLELKEALLFLDEKYRLPMMLFYGEGYSIKEIANLLEIPISTVQTRLSRGRIRLAKYYAADL